MKKQDSFESNLPLVSPMDRALFLRAQPYLSSLDASIVATLATHAEERFLRAGEWFHHEGEPVDRIAFLSEGRVSVMREGQVLCEFASPAGIGLVPAFSGLRWTPGIVATEPTVYLELPLRKFRQILEDRFPLVVQIAAGLIRQHPCPIIRGHDALDSAQATELVGRIVTAGRNPLFEEMNLIALVELLRESKETRLEAGDRVDEANAGGEEMTLVLAGELRASTPGSDPTARSGDIVGLDRFFHESTDGPCYVAVRRSRILSIRRMRYFDLLEDHFQSAEALLGLLARRVIDDWLERTPAR